jgi:hypothetical protein
VKPKQTARQKMELIEKELDKGGYLPELCREIGLSERRFMMIKQQDREKAALDYLLAHVPENVRETYWNKRKSPGRVNFNKKKAIEKAALLNYNYEVRYE